MYERTLVSIERIVDIRPIEKADAIECATVLGWETVVRKGEFAVGDLCVFHRIDSILPNIDAYSFLKKSADDEKPTRLKTVKMRGQISQGLALPLEAFGGSGLSVDLKTVPVGEDITEMLGVKKWEPPTPKELRGQVNVFTWPIDKTDRERLDDDLTMLKRLEGTPYYITEKLDGTSFSLIPLPDPDSNGDIELHICSRNHSMKYDAHNLYWRIFAKYDMERVLYGIRERFGGLVAIQGEICGPGVQKNRLGLDEPTLFIFDLIRMEENNRRSDLAVLKQVSETYSIPIVPILEEGDAFHYTTLQALQDAHRGCYSEHFPGAKPGQLHEGIVVCSDTIHPQITFKVVDKNYLLKSGE